MRSAKAAWEDSDSVTKNCLLYFQIEFLLL